MDPWTITNPLNPDEQRDLLRTKRFDFTVFQNISSEREWESLLELLQDEKFYSSKENIDSEDEEENYRQYLEDIEERFIRLEYQTEKLSFSTGGLDKKHKQTNIQLFLT